MQFYRRTFHAAPVMSAIDRLHAHKDLWEMHLNGAPTADKLVGLCELSLPTLVDRYSTLLLHDFPYLVQSSLAICATIDHSSNMSFNLYTRPGRKNKRENCRYTNNLCETRCATRENVIEPRSELNPN